MPNRMFDKLINIKIENFKKDFSNLTKDLFYDPDKKDFIHRAEYGFYREKIIREFLRFSIPRSLDLSSGFIVSSENLVSTQCDVVIYDPNYTPFFTDGDRQSFFPVELVFSVCEVKSDLTRAELGASLKKLAEIKKIGRSLTQPELISRINNDNKREYEKQSPMHHFTTILICNKFDFDITTKNGHNIDNQISELYGSDIDRQDWHNIILSIQDGMFYYAKQNQDQYGPAMQLSYPTVHHKKDGLLKFRSCFLKPEDNLHIKVFISEMYRLMLFKETIYPEILKYLSKITTDRILL